MNHALLFAVLLAAVAPPGSAAQSGPPGQPVPVPVFGGGENGSLVRADALFEAGRPLDALDLLEARLGRRPSDYEARWRAARASVALGIMAPTEPEEERWLERGIEHSVRAVELRREGVDGLYWLVASKGWLAMVVGRPARIAELADDVLADVRRLLDMRPEHDGGLHAVGKLQYEVMKLNAVERFIARHLLRVDVAKMATWDSAVEHLERAVALNPGMVLYRLDLGLTYHRSGRPERARAALRAALALPSVHPPDPVFKRRARALLEEMDAELPELPAHRISRHP